MEEVDEPLNDSSSEDSEIEPGSMTQLSKWYPLIPFQGPPPPAMTTPNPWWYGRSSSPSTRYSSDSSDEGETIPPRCPPPKRKADRLTEQEVRAIHREAPGKMISYSSRNCR